jgi:hypothetical protein
MMPVATNAANMATTPAANPVGAQWFAIFDPMIAMTIESCINFQSMEGSYAF